MLITENDEKDGQPVIDREGGRGRGVVRGK